MRYRTLIVITSFIFGSLLASAQQSSIVAGAQTTTPGELNVTITTGDTQGSTFRVFNSGNTELLRITATGNVGIGSANPTAKLFVVGDVIADNNLNTNQIGKLKILYWGSNNPSLGSVGGQIWMTAPLRWYVNDKELTSAYPSSFDIAHTRADHPVAIWGSQTTDNNFVEIATFLPNGRVGIGTTSPGAQLHVGGAPTQDVVAALGGDVTTGPVLNIGYSGASFGRSSAFFNVRPDALAVAPNPSLRFLTANVQRMIITNTGQVGIGTVTPAAGMTLDVAGNANFSGTVTGGNIQAKYQDLAEWVPAKHDLAPGTVVVLDADVGNGVTASSGPYDLTVAGVVSAQPGILLGEAGAAKAQIATTGRVRVLVDATAAPIRVGDLLVTSTRPGRAMRSEAVQINGRPFHQPGTIIGKALEPLASGEGEILVLLSLQ